MMGQVVGAKVWDLSEASVDADASPAQRFGRSYAVVVGVDAYDRARGIAPLRSAVHDAEAVGRVLARHQGFELQALMNPTAPELRALLRGLAECVEQDDRLLVYFAGHGLWREDDGGPGGYLLLRDAQARDVASFLPMRELDEALGALPCRHLLLVLDCCFAGAFRWAGTRDVDSSHTVSRQRFDRYVEASARQLIASAGADQVALDGLGLREPEGAGGVAWARHSPFATALLEGMAGAADANRDGIITATELYLYVRDRVEDATEARENLQSPGLFPLRRHDRGEFVLRTPGRPLRLPPAEVLTLDKNPYRGLSSFDEEHRACFFGRRRAAIGLAKAVLRGPLTIVLGPSGTGKSSLVKAGLVPMLRRHAEVSRPGRPRWHILGPVRPHEAIDHGLLAGPRPDGVAVVVIDQLEEVLAQRAGADAHGLLSSLARWIAEAPDLVHVIATLRSDFEPLLEDGPLAPWWQDARYVVPPMTLDELRAAIEQPADVRDLHFEPARLVDQIANEVLQMPGALPLLSFTLSELYRTYCERGEGDRALRAKDYRTLGGVGRAVTLRADAELEALVAQDPQYLHTVHNVMLRATEEFGGERARRRVPRTELVYEDAAETARVEEVLRRYVDARLFVDGAEAEGSPSDRAYVEPAHDVLIRGWPRMLRWLEEEAPRRPLCRAVSAATRVWAERGDPRHLWHADPRLPQLAPLVQDETHPLNAAELRFARESLRLRRSRRVRRTITISSVMTGLAALAVIALVQRGRAIVARDAEVRSRDRAETLVDHMAYELPDQLRAVGQPGALQGTADRIARHYDELRREASSPTLEQRRRMVAGRNALANVWIDREELAQARAAFTESLREGEALAREAPDHPKVQRDLYVAHMGLATAAIRGGDWSRAAEEQARGRRIVEALLARTPGDAHAALDLAQVQLQQGELAVWTDEARARALLSQALASLEASVKTPPEGRAKEAVLGAVRASYVLMRLMDPRTEASQLAERGRRIEQLLQSLPAGTFDARVIDGRSMGHINDAETSGLAAIAEALAHRDLAQRRIALEAVRPLHAQLVGAVRTACLDRHVLARLAPRHLAEQRRNLRCHVVLAQLYLAAGDHRRTTDTLVAARALHRELEQAFPGHPEVSRDDGIILDAAAINARQAGEQAQAGDYFTQSLALARAYAARASGVATEQVDLAISLVNLAQLEGDRGAFARAAPLAEEALSLCPASAAGLCAAVRDIAASVPRRAGPVPPSLRFQVTRISGLGDRVASGSACAAFLRPSPPDADDGCYLATISCNGWRVLGTDFSMGWLSIVGAPGGPAAACSAPSRLDLATGTLHVEESNLLGDFTLDAALLR